MLRPHEVSDRCEWSKQPVLCPVHGLTHLKRFVTPKAGGYFPAHYICGRCSVDDALANDSVLKTGETFNG